MNLSFELIKDIRTVVWYLNTETSQSALEFFPIHCPNGRLGQDLGFGGFAFALKLPELLNTNLPTVSITKLSLNWACQMGPIHCPKFLLSGTFVIP